MTQQRRQLSEWMNRAASGNGEAFGKLATAVQDDLFRFALALRLNRADAAEAAQETLLRAYGKRKTWQFDGNVTAWLFGIAMNVVRELHRKRRGSRMVDLDPAGIAGPSTDGLPDRTAGLAELAEALEALPARQREAVACRYLRGMSVKETAAVMSCAEGTVKATLHAAIENLRQRMRTRT